ncbi:MAG: T9SS type A sorting domain-containing protein [Bacteroidota bacterium]
MRHPLILTFNPTLDSLLHIDTLAPVPYYGAVTLIHEVAPDTLIIGFHKTNESRQQIMETDSLFNIRWSTEFGQQDAWVANIYDFQVTSEGDYLVSMYYYDQWTPNPLGLRKNILFKFDKVTGELLWQKEIWSGKGHNLIASMAPWQDDKVVIALDDCCEKTNPFFEIIFHEHTGMHLQIRDNDGNIHEEINLAGFLTAFVKVFPGPNAYGGDLEDPDNTAPWFIPYRIIRNPDNSYLISGMQYSSSIPGFGRGFLVKLNEELQPLWARIFEIDKKNYIYGGDANYLFNIVNTGDKIFLGGSFTTAGFRSIPSPLYPPNYPWDNIFRMGLFIPLDEHGCYEPGCHLTDNVPYYELQQAITLTPNPARDWVHIQVDHPALSHKKKVLYISDMQGNAMLTQEFTNNLVEVSLAGYAPGVYMVYIMSEGQVFRGEKLLVKD